ncbi:hypothetical protein K1719_020389 [Acacia pycnantha]|nr:hypothetical protein K1719_020389 [Acacia pycnantha]
MKRIASSEGRKIIRMGPIAFMDLCAMLEREGGLQSTQRAKPKAKEWMGKSIHNYDKLMIVCGGDRATGQHSETSKDIRKKRSPLGESESIETIEDEEVEGIKVALQDIDGALREGNAIYDKVKQKLPIPEAEIWKLLENLKIERQFFSQVYLYLLDNPERIRAVIGCHLDKRKELLLEMVFGSIDPSR